MRPLQAGFARTDITPEIGTRLIGYGGRRSGCTGVHDPLYARAAVVERNGRVWALVSLDLCYFAESFVGEVREIVSGAGAIPGDHVFLCATHTHSGPWAGERDGRPRPLPELVAETISRAAARLEDAHVAAGYGFLYGHSVNRRWLHRPIDPAVTVIRFDDRAGRALGLVANFGLHGVVLGGENLLVSADWPGYATEAIESSLGGGAVCLFTQGGAADANPLTGGVRAALGGGHTVRSIGRISAYYGPDDDPEAFNIGDRRGGTFEEAQATGLAFAEESLRVARGLRPVEPEGDPWVERIAVDASALGEGVRPRSDREEGTPGKGIPDVPDPEPAQPFELMACGIHGRSGIMLTGQPGEIFAETAMDLRRAAEKMGYVCPVVVSYAGGWKAYLPPRDAFAEEGYEVGWAESMGFGPALQESIWNVLEPRLAAHAPEAHPD